MEIFLLLMIKHAIIDLGCQPFGLGNHKIKYLPQRSGERYASALINKHLSNKMYKYFGKIKLREYVNEFIKNN